MRTRNNRLLAFCVLTSLWMNGLTECPIKLEPSTVVVRYGDQVSVNCTVSEEDHNGIGWEASEGSVEMQTGVKFVNWRLATLTDWNIGPRCFGNFPSGTGPPLQCAEKLNITVYKPPDSVLISVLNHKGPMLEGEQYLLQCDVQNIAPVQHLTVRWFKGERELENKTLFDDASKIPVNVSPTLLITPTSADDGEQYSCVAELDLGPEGPQPPPSITSEPLNITVHYAPFFYSPGRKSKNFTVEIEAIVDYLPLIAGIVALSVVFILIAFSFIYCIYYKNTKMGQYDLKVGKSRSQNAHVAQNGRDSSLPMKKLTQPV
ncbi:hypothetical protein GJAV_G00220160 [Gymnothorax javanicus]|nr:hypothetical protein GJAV_G00220160 [Gymnothorax javanicus]